MDNQYKAVIGAAALLVVAFSFLVWLSFSDPLSRGDRLLEQRLIIAERGLFEMAPLRHEHPTPQIPAVSTGLSDAERASIVAEARAGWSQPSVLAWCYGVIPQGEGSFPAECVKE